MMGIYLPKIQAFSDDVFLSKSKERERFATQDEEQRGVSSLASSTWNIMTLIGLVAQCDDSASVFGGNLASSKYDT